MLTMTAKRIGFGIETPTGHFTMDYNKAIAEWGKVTACFFLTPVSSNLSKADENLLRESIIRSFQDGSCSPKPADKPFRRSIQIVAPIGLIKIKSQLVDLLTPGLASSWDVDTCYRLENRWDIRFRNFEPNHHQRRTFRTVEDILNLTPDDIVSHWTANRVTFLSVMENPHHGHLELHYPFGEWTETYPLVRPIVTYIQRGGASYNVYNPTEELVDRLVTLARGARELFDGQTGIQKAIVVKVAAEADNWEEVYFHGMLISSYFGTKSNRTGDMTSSWTSVSETVTYHLLESAYARAIAHNWKTLKNGSGVNNYGEWKPAFVLDIIQFIPTPCIEILDLGSGIGNLSWDLGSRIRPKRSIGIEVRADLVALGRDYSSLVESQFAKFGLIPPTVLLLEGDFGVHLEVQKMVKDTATLILANNFSFDADQNDTGSTAGKLAQLLGKIQHDCLVVTMMPVSFSVGGGVVRLMERDIEHDFLSWTGEKKLKNPTYCLYFVTMH